SLLYYSLTRHFTISFVNTPHTSTTSTLSLHDALPISIFSALSIKEGRIAPTIHAVSPDPECDLDIVPISKLRARGEAIKGIKGVDRKSTRLNSSHVSISYAVFCLKKKMEK